MKTRYWVGASFCVSVLLAIVCYKTAFPKFSFHVRLTIAVDDNGVEKAASSVIELGEVGYPSLGGLLGTGSEVYSHGEAVFLDLGNGNNLFALLGLGIGSEDDVARITQATFFNGRPFTDSDYGTFAYGTRVIDANIGRPKELAVPNMPTLAHFRDLSDRHSIEPVDPANLANTCGKGVRFLRATLEITNDPITPMVIEQRLPWLRPMIGKDPSENLPPYYVQTPELSQDRIFFEGFIRE